MRSWSIKFACLVALLQPALAQGELIALPDTGQTTSYATGDDGAFRSGVAWPTPRFSAPGDGTVTDNLTGLIWLQNANCYGIQTWYAALSSVNTLASGNCGLSDGSAAGDWRLPNRRELTSLIDRSRYSPALPAGAPFTSIKSSYWSSSTYASSTGSAWYVNTQFGGIYGSSKSSGIYFWPVRGGQLNLKAKAINHDFNADSNSDVLFQNGSDGRLLIWTMDNFARTVKFPQSLASSWDVVGKGDFSGDGTADVLYMKNDGTTAIAEMTNAARSNLFFPGGINTVWSVHGVGDFNGDGTDDVLWRRSTDGVTMIWGIVNSARDKVSWPGGLASFWDIVGIGDFDNDGIDDILCQHNSDGRLLIWKMNNYGRAEVKLPQSPANTWAVVGVGDFNDDGTDDVLYRKNTGDTAVAEFTNLNRSGIKFPGGIGLPWSVKDVGDYDGDGTDDIFFRRASDGVTLVWGIVNSTRSKVAWPGALASQWLVQ